MTRHYKPGPTEPDRIPNSSVITDARRYVKTTNPDDIAQLQALNASVMTLAALIQSYQASLLRRHRVRG